VLAFSDTAQAELLRLDDGDAVSVQGALRAEAYSKDGEARVGLTVIADAGVAAAACEEAAGAGAAHERAAAYDATIPF
jgi:hypothetical protein